MSTSRTNGTAASSASKVSALARNGMLFSSAAWRVRRRKPAGERCHPPGRSRFRRAAPRSRRLRRRRARDSARRRSSSSRARRPGARGRSAGGSSAVVELVVVVVQRPPAPPCRRRTAGRARPASPRSWRGASTACAAALRRVSSPLRGAYSSASPAPSTRAPEQPLGGRVAAALDVHDLPALLATYHALLLFPGVGIVLGRHQRGLERRVVLHRRLDEAIDVLLGAVDVELLEQERERPLQVGGDGAADVLAAATRAPA